MIDFLRLLVCALTRLFCSRARLEAEILVLRHQLNVLRRSAPKRVAFSSIDRLVFAWLYRLYGFLILRHSRRDILWLGVTAHPDAEWIARQLTKAYGWRPAPRCIVRDRDCVYGDAFLRRLRAMGIRDRPTTARSPWQNGHTERLIGSIRRDCLDHVVVFGERHLRHLLGSYQRYYNDARTHLSLNKDAPALRTAQAVGRIVAGPHLGGLHHQYVRI